MRADPNWTRWIQASVINYFDTQKGSYPFFIEGETRDPSIGTYAQIRFDGPSINELSYGLFRIELLVAILIEAIQSEEDLYLLQRMIGHFSMLFDTNIPIYRFGINDDGGLLGTLILIPGYNDRIRIAQFGQVQAANKTMMASIEANYRIDLLL